MNDQLMPKIMECTTFILFITGTSNNFWSNVNV